MKPFLAVLVLAGATPTELVGQFGPLPGDAIVSESIRGVHGELAIVVLIDPDLLTGQIPEGLRLIRAGSFGLPDSILPSSAAHFVLSSFVVLVADTIELNGSPIGATNSGPASVAFWWVSTEDAPPVEDARARGNTQAVQLGLWYGDSATAAAYAAKGVAAAPAAIRATRLGAEWQFSFAIPDNDIRGRCRLLGEATPETYSLPAYSTVWHSGPVPSLFSVFTYYGHRMQRCEVIELDASGAGTLASAIRASKALWWPTAYVEDGWEANGATYRHER